MSFLRKLFGSKSTAENEPSAFSKGSEKAASNYRELGREFAVLPEEQKRHLLSMRFLAQCGRLDKEKLETYISMSDQLPKERIAQIRQEAEACGDNVHGMLWDIYKLHSEAIKEFIQRMERGEEAGSLLIIKRLIEEQIQTSCALNSMW